MLFLSDICQKNVRFCKVSKKKFWGILMYLLNIWFLKLSFWYWNMYMTVFIDFTLSYQALLLIYVCCLRKRSHLDYLSVEHYYNYMLIAAIWKILLMTENALFQKVGTMLPYFNDGLSTLCTVNQTSRHIHQWIHNISIIPKRRKNN